MNKSRYLFFLVIPLLLIISCRDNRPDTSDLSWSPDGNSLALVNRGSDELLLIDAGDHQLGQAVQLDSCIGKKSRLDMPLWSHDGRYLAYVKSTSGVKGVYLLDIKGDVKATSIPSSANRISEQPVKSDPLWSPKDNALLWIEEGFEDRDMLIRYSVDNSRPHVLLKRKCRDLSADWSADGENIFYAMHIQNSDPDNGLWRVSASRETAEQLLEADHIKALLPGPLGSHIAMIRTGPKSFHLSIFDLRTSIEKVLLTDTTDFGTMDWSPDGSRIALIRNTDNANNLDLLDIVTGERIRLSSDNLDGYLGWQAPHTILYAIEKPESLTSMSEFEEDQAEYYRIMHDLRHLNKIISYDGVVFKTVAEDVVALNRSRNDNTTAFFLPYSIAFLSSERYLPAIRFNAGHSVYPARTRSQHLAASDMHFKNGEYNNSLRHLESYWDIDIPDLAAFIEAASAPDSDSLKRVRMTRSIEDNALLRTIMTLRERGDSRLASDLFNQFQTAFDLNLRKSGADKEIDEDIFWSLAQLYTKFEEYEQGMDDLDRLAARYVNDSLLTAHFCFSRGALAFNAGNGELALDMVLSGIESIPNDIDDTFEALYLMYLILQNGEIEYRPDRFSDIKSRIERYVSSEDIFDYNMFWADYFQRHGDIENARAALRSAAATDFATADLWQRIIELEME
jgi:Tol biopolymer transport system component